MAICVWRGEGERKKKEGTQEIKGKSKKELSLPVTMDRIVDTGLYSKAAIVKYRR